MVTIKEAEDIRKALGLSAYQFSVKLGYSPTAYPYAVRTKNLSRWMKREIATRFGRILSEVRS